MGKKCQISGKAGQFGHRVSHANNKTKHLFRPNLQSKRIFVAEEGRYVRVSVSTRVLRTIDKIGLMATLKKHKLSLKDLVSGPKTAKKVATPKAATPKTVAAKSA